MKTPLYIFLLFSRSAANAQRFKNLDFSQACDSSKTGLCYWDLSWGNKGSISRYNYGKNRCLLINGSKQNDVGFIEQTGIIYLKGIQIIIVSAAIKPAARERLLQFHS